MGFLGKLWRGEYPLWQTYWVFNLLFSLLITFAINMLSSAAIHGVKAAAVMLLPFGVAALAYSFVALVGLKKSADEYMGNVLWKYLAYFVVFLGGITLAGAVLQLLNIS